MELPSMSSTQSLIVYCWQWHFIVATTRSKPWSYAVELGSSGQLSGVDRWGVIICGDEGDWVAGYGQNLEIKGSEQSGMGEMVTIISITMENQETSHAVLTFWLNLNT